jgi:hypothetical protein
MRALIAALTLIPALAAGQVMHQDSGKVLTARNRAGGFIYLMPKQGDCPDGFKEVFADDVSPDTGEPVKLHGCWREEEVKGIPAAIIITDDNEGYAIPLEFFHAQDEA